MATKYWVGRAASVAQVTKIAYSAVTIGETYSVTINGKTVEHTATTTALADLVDALITAWEASAEPEHQEMTAAEHTTASVLDGLQLTANTTGIPITVTADATGAPTATVTNDTDASGPNFWDDADNWDGAALPATGDTIIIEDSDVDILYGLTDTNNYARLDVMASFTGAIGLPETNANGYPEYRTRYLTLGDGTTTITVNIGQGDGNQPERVLLDLADSEATATIFDGRQSQATYPIELLNPDSASTIAVYGGAVLLDDSTTGTWASLKVVARSGSRSQAKVKTTSRITTTSVLAYGGEVLLNGSGTTLTARESARVTVASAAAYATVIVSSRAEINWETSGGIATLLESQANGKIDFGRAASAKTVAAAKIFPGGTILDPIDIVTWTAGVALQGCRLADVTLDLGIGVTVT